MSSALQQITGFLKTIGEEQAQFIEQRLGIADAGKISPIDIARISAATLAGGEVDYALPPQHPLTPQQAALIGNPTSQGLIAQAIRNASSILPESEYRQFEYKLAQTLAYSFLLSPQYIPEPGVRIDYKQQLLSIDQRKTLRLPFSPLTLVEYGPGLSSAHKMAKEYSYAPQTVGIEKNTFVNEFLTALAVMYGFNPFQTSKFVGRVDGIRSATNELLNVSSGGNWAHMVIASQIQTASKDELEAGIENGYKLLQPGGLFVFRGSDRSAGFNPDLSADEFLSRTKKVFGKSPLYQTNIVTFSEKRHSPGTGKAFVIQK